MQFFETIISSSANRNNTDLKMLRALMIGRQITGSRQLVSSRDNVRSSVLDCVCGPVFSRNRSDSSQTLNLSSIPEGSKKASKKQVRKIKTLHKENKALFGVLLETKPEKTKRIQKEGKAVKALQNSSSLKKPKDVSHKKLGKKEPSPTVKTETTKRWEDYTHLQSVEGMPLGSMPGCSSVRFEQAGASIKKYKRKTESSNDDNKGSEIEWTMKSSPSRVKLLGLSAKLPSPVGTPASPSHQAVEDMGYNQGNQMVATKKNKKSSSLSPSSPMSLNHNDNLHIHQPFDVSLPYYNTDKENVAGASEAEDLSASDIILSFPYTSSPQVFVTNSESNLSHSSEPALDTRIERRPQEKVPSVSRILQATMSQEQAEALKRWEQRMIAEKGEQGFLEYKQGILNNGKLLHSNIEQYLRGTPEEQLVIAKQNQGHWNSINAVLQSIGEQHQLSRAVHVLESYVVHPKLQYCGVIDCVAEFGNRLVVIDWKTSQKHKPFISMTYDTPLQIAAYIGAINYDPRYYFKINDGLIVVAYEDGSTCQTFLLGAKDVEKYWKLWLRRLQMYRKINAAT